VHYLRLVMKLCPIYTSEEARTAAAGGTSLPNSRRNHPTTQLPQYAHYGIQATCELVLQLRSKTATKYDGPEMKIAAMTISHGGDFGLIGSGVRPLF
jgi:hypothetical protein